MSSALARLNSSFAREFISAFGVNGDQNPAALDLAFVAFRLVLGHPETNQSNP
jgi:hypothetical protein